MPRTSNNQYQERIRATAIAFISEKRDAERIMQKVGIAQRTLYRIIVKPEFHAALDAMSYAGDRSLKSKPTRHLPPLYIEAKQRWDALEGMTQLEKGRIIRKELGVPMSQLKNWIQRWKGEKR